MTVRVVPYAHDDIFNEMDLAVMPEVGQYLAVPRQKQVGYKVEKVILLMPNDLGWDALIVLGNGSGIEREHYNTLYQRVYKEKLDIKRKNYQAQSVLKDPDERWKRRMRIYERIQAGETAEDIAKEMSISVGRVKTLSSEWNRLVEHEKFRKLREKWEEEDRLRREELRRISL